MSQSLSATQLRVRVRAQLREAGVPSPDSDASRLVAAALATTPAGIPLAAPPSQEQQDLLEQWVTRRCGREPLQHILGTAPFATLELAVGPGVFVPRPETEVLLTAALQRLRHGPPAPTVVDLCSGSGAIALGIALSIPHAEVFAVELSESALPWLRANVEAHAEQVAQRGSSVTVVSADATADPIPQAHGNVDLVASNPPYIPEGCTPRDPEVFQFDPPIALYGGGDGLDVVRGVIGTAGRLLRPGGMLLIEHGDNQGWGQPASVPQLLDADQQFAAVDDLEDLAGRPRVTTALRRSTAPGTAGV